MKRPLAFLALFAIALSSFAATFPFSYWKTVASGFSPASISGLQLWLKADALAGLADGTAVSSWTDSSGNGRAAAQASGTLQPLYKTAIVNSLPVVRFDGSNDFLRTGNFTVNQPITVFAVVKAAALGADEIIFDSANSSPRAVLDLSTTGPSGEAYAGASLLNSAVTASRFQLWSAIFNGASSKLAFDGAAGVTGDPGSMGFNG
ncbi:MAG: hypothetical protein LC734_11470, partial [Acidobacteria bacterium]|nr:hypothetical protein [Acidobacteriota bacterium]